MHKSALCQCIEKCVVRHFRRYQLIIDCMQCTYANAIWWDIHMVVRVTEWQKLPPSSPRLSRSTMLSRGYCLSHENVGSMQKKYDTLLSHTKTWEACKKNTIHLPLCQRIAYWWQKILVYDKPSSMPGNCILMAKNSGIWQTVEFTSQTVEKNMLYLKRQTIKHALCVCVYVVSRNKQINNCLNTIKLWAVDLLVPCHVKGRSELRDCKSCEMLFTQTTPIWQSSFTYLAALPKDCFYSERLRNTLLTERLKHSMG